MDFPGTEQRWRGELEQALPWMQILARRLVHGEEEARELVQETWLAALTRPPVERGRPRAWLRTVMSNLARQRGRRTWVKRRSELPELEPLDPGPGPGSSEEQAELERLILGELTSLDEPFRSTLEQHYLRGLLLVQIARRDGVPEGTVRWRLKAGIERLRLRLDQRYGNRQRWLAALLPFAGPRPRPTPPSAPFPWAPVALLAGGFGLAALILWRPWRDAPAPPEPVAAQRAVVRDDPGPRAAPAQPTLAPEPATESSSTEPSAGALTLAVRVVDAHGTPVPGAALEVWSAQGFEVRAHSDASGAATLTPAHAEFGALDVPFARKRLVVRASAAGHATSEAAFLRADALTTLELALRGPERVLRGRVSEGPDRPLEGVAVYAVLDPARTTPAVDEDLLRGPLALGTRSAVDGSYELRGLEKRPYAVVVSRAGCEPSLRMIDAEKEELPLVFVPEARVTGRVVDERGRPASGARVWADPLHVGTDWCAGIPGYASALRGFALETVSAADGSYELFDLHPRVRRLCAELPGPGSAVARTQLPLVAGSALTWDAFLTPAPAFRAHLADEDGRDLAGWVAVLVGRLANGASWTRVQVADARGRVEFREGAGEAELLVLGPSGQGEPRATGRVSADDVEQTVVVATASTTHLVGRIPSEYLAHDPEARVIAFHLDSRQPFTLELEPASGRFKAELDAAEYALLLTGEKGAAWLADVTLARGERRRLGKLSLPATGHALLRADRDTRAGTWRLELCFARSSMKWREGSLPLLEERELLAGLYRLDAVGVGGVLESAWLEVEAGKTSELDLERLARVEVEVRGPEKDGARRARLLVLPRAAGGRAEARQVSLPPRVDGRQRHALRLPQGGWTIELHDENGLVERGELEVPSAGERRLELGRPR